jgi:hypothetical protein
LLLIAFIIPDINLKKQDFYYNIFFMEKLPHLNDETFDDHLEDLRAADKMFNDLAMELLPGSKMSSNPDGSTQTNFRMATMGDSTKVVLSRKAREVSSVDPDVQSVIYYRNSMQILERDSDRRQLLMPEMFANLTVQGMGEAWPVEAVGVENFIMGEADLEEFRFNLQLLSSALNLPDSRSVGNS